jgi:hypothetical protein
MTPAQSDDINRELQATLQARRELGTTAYDEHFIEALVEKLRAEVRAAQPQHRDVGPPSEQRLGLAICSLVFAIPLVAIASGNLVGLILVCATIVGINVAFNWQR